MSHEANILLARIGAPHGVKGEVRVKSFTGEPAALAEHGPLTGEDGRALFVERLRPEKTIVIVKFAGVDNRDAAERLNGLGLYVPRAALPDLADEDEFYHADLIGLAAVGLDGAELGTVTAVHDFGAGDMLEIAPEAGPTLLVPFTKAAVPSVDLAARRIVVDPPAEAAEEEGGG